MYLKSHKLFDWVVFDDGVWKEEVILASEKFEVVDTPNANGGTKRLVEHRYPTRDKEGFERTAKNNAVDSNRKRHLDDLYGNSNRQGARKDLAAERAIAKEEALYEVERLAGRVKTLEKEVERKNLQIVELEADVESLKEILKLHGLPGPLRMLECTGETPH